MWGAKHHPGNGIYVILVIVLFGLAFKNDNLVAGLMASAAVTVLLVVMYVFTSISVGRANKKLIDDEVSDD